MTIKDFSRTLMHQTDYFLAKSVAQDPIAKSQELFSASQSRSTDSSNNSSLIADTLSTTESQKPYTDHKIQFLEKLKVYLIATAGVVAATSLLIDNPTTLIAKLRQAQIVS